MSEIEDALGAMVTLVKTIDVINPPGNRVWQHPGETAGITVENLPIAIVSKMNAQPGAWQADSFGAGRHEYEILIAVLIKDGPIVVTNSNKNTIEAMANASEWYKKLADLLYANMTLNGSVDIIGDEDGKLFEYITDNIIWDAKQYYGHLFIIPVVQTIIQGVSALKK